jgi:hypothetical protein
MLPKVSKKGEKVGVCNTTSAEYKTPKTQIIYLVPDILPEYGLVGGRLIKLWKAGS